ncbi:MAG: hypothetical protein M1819_007258 [Sarea resinae]|nr:MAG: hypothetical protein M1819_007258 [Sarea resinae]
MAPSTITTSATRTATSAATSSCVSMTPGKNGYLPPEACNSILTYHPSLAAAVIFALFFGIGMCLHMLQAVTFRKRFCWVIIMGAAWETVSFIMRALLTRHQNNQTYNTVSQLLLLLAPLWINAFDYMILGRLVYFFLPDRKLFGIHATKFSKYFVWLDIVSFIVQAAGASITTSNNVKQSTLENGIHIYMGGIGLQQFFIVIFTFLVISLHRKLLKMEWQGTLVYSGSMQWRWLFYGLYGSLTLITVRIIFRMCEYAQGTSASNPVPNHEAYEYCLDAMPMLFAVFLMNFTHPGRVLVGPESEFPRISRKEKKRLKAEKKADKVARKAAKKSGRRHGGGGDWQNQAGSGDVHVPLAQQHTEYGQAPTYSGEVPRYSGYNA